MTPADRRFEALIFDWDGTAVPDRQADAGGIRDRVERLCRAGMNVFIVSGTHVGNVDGQLQARPAGPGRLFLALNRGSEVFEVTESGASLLSTRRATEGEERALERAAERAVTALGAVGLRAEIVSARLNRRKIDLIPEPEWADPPKSRIDALLGAVTERLHRAGTENLAAVVSLIRAAAQDAGLADPRITSDVKHVEIGLTDKSDSARWAGDWLARIGITGRLILVAGDEFGPIGGVPGSDSLMLVPELARADVVSVGVEPGGTPAGIVHLGGGPAAFELMLDAQLAHRADGRVPGIDPDPAWIVPLPSETRRSRVAEAVGALANGRAGVRAVREDDGSPAPPPFLVSGVYTGDGSERLLPGPVWTGLTITPRTDDAERRLDLRTGVVERADGDGSGLRTLRFVSAADPYALALRAEGPTSRIAQGDALGDPGDGTKFERGSSGPVRLARTSGHDAAITVAARDRTTTRHGRRTVERLAAWMAGPAGTEGWGGAPDLLGAVQRRGFDRLLADHRAAWAGRWRDAEVSIEGSPEDQLAARFAVFHLLGAAPDDGEAAVGARGLTGPAYGGHVFWDTDVYALPALAAIRPGAARALLEYRVRRLPAARARALAAGRRGARFPWESGRDGSEVTPRYVRGPGGGPVPVRTGQHEVHIVADIAWAADHYAAWTGDTAFLRGAGRDLLLDTARYWASRARRDSAGRAHLYGVMGPDEYHEVVDDNAFTNLMARWNLRRAAGLVDEIGGDTGEAAGWRELADELVDGYDPERGLYEQFAGYWRLEPLLLDQFASPPVAADVLLGAERVAGSQLIKQADVLMAHHLVPDDVVPGSLTANLAYYEPRTAHGSSLSPAIHASLLARAGQPDRALVLFRLAARLDLDDLTGTTAGGLHLATLGGVWQALCAGFVGLRPGPDGLQIDPNLPEAWDALAVRFRFRGQPIGVRAEPDRVVVSCREPLTVRIGAQDPQRCDPPSRSFATDRSLP